MNAKYEKEILMSRKIIEKKWNIGCLHKFYKNVYFTFKNKLPKQNNIKFLGDIMYSHYKDKLWTNKELVFVKGNRK